RPLQERNQLESRVGRFSGIALLRTPLVQIVHFDQSNSGGVAYTAYDGGIVARWQICNNRRLACCSRSVTTVLDIANLITGDNSAEYRCLPVVIRSNQCSGSVVKFQSRIG